METTLYDEVHRHYSAAAAWSPEDAYGRSVAQAFGYSDEDLAGHPAAANLGLSCGNPLAMAGIKEGETVVDLGCGAGFDVFQAADKVGPRGRVIGVDMNEDMLARAAQIKSARNRNRNRSANEVEEEENNVRFVLSRITSIPQLGAATADCVISNCVVNLVPDADKQAAFDEMFRLLKPGGRLAVSDILAKKPLPPALRRDVALYVGCIAGASLVEEYEAYLRRAGFRDVVIADTHSDLNVYRIADGGNGNAVPSCCGPGAGSCGGGDAAEKDPGGAEALPDYGDLNEWAGSYKIFAVK